MKYLLCFLSLMFGASAFADAQDDESYTSLKVDNIVHKVKQIDYNDIERSLSLVAKGLQECKSVDAIYHDPLINRTNSYSVQPKGAYCNVLLIKDTSWTYSCQFLMSDARALAKSLNQRIARRELLGDFTPVEQSLYFNQNKCEATEV